MQNPGGFVFRSNSAESLSLEFTAHVAVAAVADATAAGGRFVPARSIHGRSAANADTLHVTAIATSIALTSTNLPSVMRDLSS